MSYLYGYSRVKYLGWSGFEPRFAIMLTIILLKPSTGSNSNLFLVWFIIYNLYMKSASVQRSLLQIILAVIHLYVTVFLHNKMLMNANSLYRLNYIIWLSNVLISAYILKCTVDILKDSIYCSCILLPNSEFVWENQR